jgi:hypothetical protein
MTSKNRLQCAMLLHLVLAFLTVPLIAQARGSLRFTIVVDKFENKSGNDQIGDEWATLLTSALHESGHFIVVAQDDMQLKALNEQLRNASGSTVQGRKSAQRAQMAPAQLLVKGVITHLQQGAANQDGGVGVGRFRVSGVNLGRDDDVQAAFQKAIAEVIPWLVAQLPSVPWRGSVVRIADGRIIINRGSREGVAAGDEFVAGESEILRDPDTGEVLDEVLHERARIRVERITDRTATCSVVTGNASQLVVGMAIQYSREVN